MIKISRLYSKYIITLIMFMTNMTNVDPSNRKNYGWNLGLEALKMVISFELWFLASCMAAIDDSSENLRLKYFHDLQPWCPVTKYTKKYTGTGIYRCV